MKPTEMFSTIDRTSDIDPSRLVDICQAEGEGRLVVLPCKVGDTVYCLENNTIYEDKIHEIKISENETFFNLDFGDRFSVWIPIERIGKTVFLTRAEAEKGEGE